MHRLLTRVGHPTFERDDTSAMSWVVTCACGTTVSLWDVDRIRATMTRMRRTATCPTCERRFVGEVRRVPV